MSILKDSNKRNKILASVGTTIIVANSVAGIAYASEADANTIDELNNSSIVTYVEGGIDEVMRLEEERMKEQAQVNKENQANENNTNKSNEAKDDKNWVEKVIDKVTHKEDETSSENSNTSHKSENEDSNKELTKDEIEDIVNSKNESQEESKDDSKNESQEESKDDSKNESQEESKDDSKDESQNEDNSDKELTKDEIKDIVNSKNEESDKEVTKDEIKDIVNSKNEESNKELTKDEIKDIVNSKNENSNKELTKDEIKDIVNSKNENSNKELTKDEIEDIVNSGKTNTDDSEDQDSEDTFLDIIFESLSPKRRKKALQEVTSYAEVQKGLDATINGSNTSTDRENTTPTEGHKKVSEDTQNTKKTENAKEETKKELSKHGYPTLSKEEMLKIIDEACKEYDVDPALAKAQAKHESNFDQDIVSHAGAAGVMQLMKTTAKGLGLTVNNNVDERFDPVKNIYAGVKYIKQCEKYSKHYFNKVTNPLILSFYNAGIKRVLQYNGVPDIKETKDYIQRVTTSMKEFM